MTKSKKTIATEKELLKVKRDLAALQKELSILYKEREDAYARQDSERDNSIREECERIIEKQMEGQGDLKINIQIHEMEIQIVDTRKKDDLDD